MPSPDILLEVADESFAVNEGTHSVIVTSEGVTTVAPEGVGGEPGRKGAIGVSAGSLALTETRMGEVDPKNPPSSRPGAKEIRRPTGTAGTRPGGGYTRPRPPEGQGGGNDGEGASA